jgi:hypothetical protein
MAFRTVTGDQDNRYPRIQIANTLGQFQLLLGSVAGGLYHDHRHFPVTEKTEEMVSGHSGDIKMAGGKMRF